MHGLEIFFQHTNLFLSSTQYHTTLCLHKIVGTVPGSSNRVVVSGCMLHVHLCLCSRQAGEVQASAIVILRELYGFLISSNPKGCVVLQGSRTIPSGLAASHGSLIDTHSPHLSTAMSEHPFCWRYLQYLSLEVSSIFDLYAVAKLSLNVLYSTFLLLFVVFLILAIPPTLDAVSLLCLSCFYRSLAACCWVFCSISRESASVTLTFVL